MTDAAKTNASRTGPAKTDPATLDPAKLDPTKLDSANSRLERVRGQLRLYEHPLFDFDAQAKGDGVEVLIHAKAANAQASRATEISGAQTYVLALHPRDIDHPQFEWQFQRQFYDALHDYLIEMFVRTPQDRSLRNKEARRGQ